MGFMFCLRTYMRPEEKYKPAFVRPKRWFKRKDYKKTQKQKAWLGGQ